MKEHIKARHDKQTTNESVHKRPRNIGTTDSKEQEETICDQYEFKCKTVGEFVEHLLQVHRIDTDIYQCNFCMFKCIDKTTLDQHIVELHEMITILTGIAQNQEYVSESFEKLKAEFSRSMNEIMHSQNSLKQELFIIRKSCQNLEDEKKEKENAQPSSTSSSPGSGDLPPGGSPTPSSKTYAASASKHPKVTVPSFTVHPPSMSPQRLPRASRKKVNVCFVGDSIAHNVNTVAVEEATRTIIRKRKAYGSVKDDVSLYPTKNFTDVVPDELVQKHNLTGQDYDVLLLQASASFLN